MLDIFAHHNDSTRSMSQRVEDPLECREMEEESVEVVICEEIDEEETARENGKEAIPWYQCAIQYYPEQITLVCSIS